METVAAATTISLSVSTNTDNFMEEHFYTPSYSSNDDEEEGEEGEEELKSWRFKLTMDEINNTDDQDLNQLNLAFYNNKDEADDIDEDRQEEVLGYY